MKTINGMFADELWNALVSCNPDYDGTFLYAIHTTGIFCRPSCRSKTPNSENVSFYATAWEAMEAGYRTCKRCRPDLNSYDPCEKIINETKGIMEQEYSHRLVLTEIAQKAGVSKFHLHRLFQNSTGETPHKYLERVRVRKAKELLVNTKRSVAAIAFQAGFQSISGFYNAFRRETGTAPNRYRSERQSDYPDKKGDRI
ncbi:bifunctional transcriptional activator/DNA repair enzyme AdaA [Virgibacillus siamensis]|uniref:bifunctional transcriptional activator/DNA repair enzyme AdaA n=1 Tax=Virgibacillus siamensis TaxID=480071 RepID=UPI000987B1D5|nr:Ada metal-binding domain-containing protein [Virgibacillus siamensis]